MRGWARPSIEACLDRMPGDERFASDATHSRPAVRGGRATAGAVLAGLVLAVDLARRHAAPRAATTVQVANPTPIAHGVGMQQH